MKRKVAGGYTLTEVAMAVALIGVLFALGSNLLTQITRFVKMHIAKTEIQRDARVCLDTMDRELREATASSAVVDQVSGQPPYSRITFTRYRPDGTTETISYYQQGNSLYLQIGSALAGYNQNPVLLSNNLLYVAFTYLETDISSIVSVSLTMQKATYGGLTKALQMAVETVRIMN